jgi:hypothetical protein
VWRLVWLNPEYVWTWPVSFEALMITEIKSATVSLFNGSKGVGKGNRRGGVTLKEEQPEI